MNPLQLDNFLPQAVQTLDSVKNLRTGSTAFADALKAAQNEADTEEVKNREVSKHDSSWESKKTETSETKETEKNQKNSDSSENDNKIAKSSESENLNAENQAVQTQQNVENKVKLVVNENESANIVENLETVETSENLINEQALSWLASSERIIGNSDSEAEQDNFAALIDAAIEFIPGTETEEEKLASAQNLSVADPEAFLNSVQLPVSEIAENLSESQTALKNSDKIQSSEKKSEAKVTVYDLRTKKSVEGTETVKAVQKAADKKELALDFQQKNQNTMQVNLDMADKVQANITSSSSQAAGANGSTFQTMLSNTIQQNAPEFVKAGNIILRDNNKGTINLIVKPEQLGNVKISLSLNDKVISGQISVASKDAMEAMRQSIDSLKQAFTESGFETGAFDLNFSDNQQSFAQSGNGSQNQQSEFLAKQAYGDFISIKELGSESSERAYTQEKISGVNIVA